MKLKLSNEDLLIFINELKNCDQVRFTTTLESKLVGFILVDFTQRLMGKFMKNQQMHKIEFDGKTLLALNEVMPQLRSKSEDHYAVTVIRDIYLQINTACLSIL